MKRFKLNALDFFTWLAADSINPANVINPITYNIPNTNTIWTLIAVRLFLTPKPTIWNRSNKSTIVAEKVLGRIFTDPDDIEQYEIRNMTDNIFASIALDSRVLQINNVSNLDSKSHYFSWPYKDFREFDFTYFTTGMLRMLLGAEILIFSQCNNQNINVDQNNFEIGNQIMGKNTFTRKHANIKIEKHIAMARAALAPGNELPNSAAGIPCPPYWDQLGDSFARELF